MTDQPLTREIEMLRQLLAPMTPRERENFVIELTRDYQIAAMGIGFVEKSLQWYQEIRERYDPDHRDDAPSYKDIAESASQHAADLHAKNEALTDEHDLMGHELQRANEQLAAMTAKAKQAEHRESAALTQLATMLEVKQQLAQVQQQRDANFVVMKDLNEEIAELRQQLAVSEENMDTRTALEKERDTLQARVTALEDETCLLRQERNSYKDNILPGVEARMLVLEEALTKAVKTIQIWHGIHSGHQRDSLWNLYQGSPEMKLIIKALAPAQGKPHE